MSKRAEIRALRRLASDMSRTPLERQAAQNEMIQYLRTRLNAIASQISALAGQIEDIARIIAADRRPKPAKEADDAE